MTEWCPSLHNPNAQPACVTCDTVKVLKDRADDGKPLLNALETDLGNSVFTYSEIRPNAKEHCVLVTKKHNKDVWDISQREWNDMLPVLKDNIAKINRVYSPPGFRIGISVGKFGLQNKNHFYCRIVPKYMINEGTYSTGGQSRRNLYRN